MSSSNSSIPTSTRPSAPLINTVTVLSATSVSVYFIIQHGTGAITNYTVTSSPGGLTGTGSTSPITVSGLTSNTEYTFTMTATNSSGTSVASNISSAITTYP